MFSVERISGWLVAGVLPLIYVTVLVSIIEALLIWGHSRLGFQGIFRLSASNLRGGSELPETDEPYFGQVGHISYCLLRGGELRFTGRPGIRLSGYVLRAKVVNLRNYTRLEVWAPLSMCLAFVGACMLLAGLSVLGFIADGFTAGIVYLAVGVGLVALFRWRVRGQVTNTELLLEDVLQHLDEQSYLEDDEESVN
jgi:hypothetical protein